MRHDSLPERIALITGASRGLGLELAQKMLAAGYFVILNARDAKRLATVQAALAKELSHQSAVFAVDVSAKAYAEKLAVLMRKHGLGHLDVVVHCAGVNHMGTIAQIKSENAEITFRTNAFSVIALAQATRQYLEAAKAPRFVLVSSLMKYFAMPGRSVYAASKVAAEYFAVAWGEELKLQNSPIRVQIFRPAGIETGFHGNTRTDGHAPKSDVSRMHPEQVAGYLMRFIHSNKFESAPGLMNKFAAFIARHFPRLTRYLVLRRQRSHTPRRS